MGVNNYYNIRLENDFKNLVCVSKKLKEENEELKDILKRMAEALIPQNSCYLQKERCEWLNSEVKNNCIKCIIDNFKKK